MLDHNIDLPQGHNLEIDHICRNRGCVNPSHLRLITHRENTLCGIGITARNATVTHCPQGHPYDLFNTYHRPDGGRECKICMRIRKHNKEVEI